MASVERIDQGAEPYALRSNQYRTNRVTYGLNVLEFDFLTPFVGDIFVAPTSASIRGGDDLVIYGEPVLVSTNLNESFTTGVPVDWAFSGTGTVTARPDGLLLSAGSAATGTAILTSPDALLHFDVSVDVRLVAPKVALTPCTLATLEAFNAFDIVRLALVLYPDRSVRAESSVDSSPGGVIGVADTTGVLTLRLVRNGTRVWGFVNDEQVLAYDALATASLTPRFGVRNNNTTAGVRTVFSNFVVGSHASINHRLIENKIDAEQHRIIGEIPAATVHELGAATLRVFGPWGELEVEDAFEYTQPPRATVSFDGTRSIVTFTDAALYD